MLTYYDEVRNSLEGASQHYAQLQKTCTKLGQRNQFGKIARVADTMRRSIAEDGTIAPLKEIVKKTSIPLDTLKRYLYTLTTFTKVRYRFRDDYVTQGRRKKLNALEDAVSVLKGYELLLKSRDPYLTHEQLISGLGEARKHYASAAEQTPLPRVKLKLKRLAITASALEQNLRGGGDGKETYFSFNDISNKCEEDYLAQLQAFAGDSSKKGLARARLSGSYLERYRTRGSLAGMDKKGIDENIKTVLNHIKLRVKGDERARYSLVVHYEQGKGHVSYQNLRGNCA